MGPRTRSTRRRGRGSAATPEQGGRQRADRHEHPGGRGRRARRRQDRRAARRTRAGRAAPRRHRRHRQRAAPARGLAAARSAAYADALLLVGDHVPAEQQRPTRMMGREGFFPGRARQHRRSYDVDISDPAHPRLADSRTLVGQQVSMRQYGDTVRLVTTIGLPQLPLRRSPTPAALSEHRGRATQPRDRARARGSRTGSPGLSTAPTSTTRAPGPGRTRWPCATFRPGDADDASQVAVTGAGSEVYSSTDRLYVTSTDWGSRPILRWTAPDTTTRSDQLGRAAATARPTSTPSPSTATAPATSPRAPSTAPSRTAGRSTSRTATSASPSPGPTERARAGDNGIVVLDERGGRLEQVGDAARARDRRADPVGALVRRPGRRGDLPADRPALHDRPERPDPPATAGRAEDPGLLLLPAPDRRRPAARPRQRRHRRRPAASAPRPPSSTSRDTSAARQVGKVTFGTDSWLEAAEDPHAFTWLPGRATQRSRASRTAHGRRWCCCASRPTGRCQRARARVGRRLGTPGAPARGRPGRAGRRPRCGSSTSGAATAQVRRATRHAAVRRRWLHRRSPGACSGDRRLCSALITHPSWMTTVGSRRADHPARRRCTQIPEHQSDSVLSRHERRLTRPVVETDCLTDRDTVEWAISGRTPTPPPEA